MNHITKANPSKKEDEYGVLQAKLKKVDDVELYFNGKPVAMTDSRLLTI